MSASDDAKRAFALEVVKRLQQAGHRALWAGGCVRDLLMNREPSDYDVATDATPDRVMSLFRRTIPVGISFGVVRVLGPRAADAVEVATFRSDGLYHDGRRPESVTFGTPEADAKRRDFTINGMFLDPSQNQLIDLVGGQADLEAGILRAIGNPAERFAEDKLRLLRAVRFAARLNFTLDDATRAAISAMADQLPVVSAERIAEELRRMLVHPSRVRAMSLAFDLGLVATILPPLQALPSILSASASLPGESLWSHTLRVLDLLGDSASFPLAFAALLHDVGKTKTNMPSDRRGESIPHEAPGRTIADELGRDLKLANVERERIGWLIENQQALVAAPTLRASQLKRLLAKPGIDELLSLHRAEALATSGDVSHVDFCESYLLEQPFGPINPPPLVTGRDLSQLGLPPGPLYAEILEILRDAQLDGLISTHSEALEWVRLRLDSGNFR